MLNNQKPEGLGVSSTLQVHSIFETIQGEGPFAGRPAIFVRLAGCNLQCPACDTEYTSVRTPYTPEQLVNTLDSMCDTTTNALSPYWHKKLIVITGGEPFRQRIGKTLQVLLLNGYEVQVETNGTLYDPRMTSDLMRGRNLHFVCSPKTAALNKYLLTLIGAFKYVLKHGQVAADGLPVTALDHPCSGVVYRPGPTFPRNKIYIQPLDEGNPEANRKNLEAAISSSKKFGYTFCLQVHKIINLP